MAIIAKFTRTLPAPTATISSGFVFLLSAGWFTDADQGVAGSPIDGGTNSLANGGGDMQIFSDTDTTTQLPIEVVTFVTGVSPDAQVWVRTPNYTAGDTITVGKDDIQTVQPAVGAAFGRNATWQDFEYNFHLDATGKLTDSTGNYSLTEAGTVSNIIGQIGDGVTYSNSASNTLTIVGYTGVLGSAARTHKLWGKTTSTNSRGMVGYGHNATGERYNVRIDDTSGSGRFRTEISGSFAITDNTFNDGNWHHFVSKTDGTATFPACYTAVVDGADQTVTVGGDVTLNIVADVSLNFDSGDITTGNISTDQDEQSLRVYETDAATDSSEYLNQSDPDNFGTSSEWILVSSGISINAESQNYNVTFYDAVIGFTGEIVVPGESQSYNVTFYDAEIDLTGDVIVNAESQSYQVQFFDGQVSLISGIEVQAQAQTYDVTFYDALVVLSGEIAITAESQNYSVTFYDATVSITELWTNKPKAVTNWSNQANTVTIWTDK